MYKIDRKAVRIKIIFSQTLYSQSIASVSMGSLAAHLRSSGFQTDLCFLDKGDMVSFETGFGGGIGSYIVIAKPNFKDFPTIFSLLERLKSFGWAKRIFLCGPFAQLNADKIMSQFGWLDGIFVDQPEASSVRLLSTMSEDFVNWDLLSPGSISRDTQSGLVGKYVPLSAPIPLSNIPFPARDIEMKVLFEEHALSPNIDYKRGIGIAFSFLKELTSLDKIKNEYVEEEDKINSNFNGQPNPDGSFYLPSIQNLEQKVKTFITNIDHTARLLIETAQLFYPDIKNKNWEEQLYQKVSKQFRKDHECAIFIESFKKFTGLIRKIRNSIEHPDNDNIFVINNYKLSPQNILNRPSLSFIGKNYSLPETNISEFITISVENMLLIFESLIAHLCSVHTKPFAGDKRIVVEVPPEKRPEQEKHVKFRYQILWTK